MWSERTARVLAVIILGFYLGDVLLLGGFNPWALGLRVLWAGVLLGYAAFNSSVSETWERWLKDLHVVIITCCILGLVVLTGGLFSPYFVLVPVLPIANCLMYRRGGRAGLLSGAVGSVGTFVLSWWMESLVLESIIRTSIVLAITLFTTYLTQQMRQTQGTEQEVRLERARREAVEALAVQDHRRAQTEKLAAIGRLASEVAHEINNPLAYVDANVDFVREGLRRPGEASADELDEVLEQTREGLRHIRQVVADLKGFARMDTQEPSECALADVVADALKLASLRLKHVARVSVEIPRELPGVFVVRQRLVQVVLNLLVNAGDALEEYGVRGGEVCVRALDEGERVLLLIEDNGPGFAPEVLPRLFEPFFTTKGPDKGTGLGLNLSRELVAQCGGVLQARNRPGGGAHLRLEFPARLPEAARVRKAS
jgi:signal transduction histidine kinase